MRKKIILILTFCVIASCGLIASAVLSNNHPGALNVLAAQTSGENMTTAEMQQAIEELRALINLLVLNMTNTQQQNTQAGIPSISGQRAREIAQEFIGYGKASDILLFSDNGVLTFEVEVLHENLRYIVYVNATSGSIVRTSRFEDGYESRAALPDATVPQVSAAPNPSQNSAPTPTPNTSQSSNRRIRPINPAISLERAIEIGYQELARRGHTGTFRKHSGMDWERNQWVWEVEFRVPGGRRPFVEMYINVDTGVVVNFEWDD